MKAIRLKKFGGPEEMFIGPSEIPKISDFEILVQIKCSALNRADTLQRRGKYPPPPGASDILGLEMAGEVVEIGKAVTKWKIGDSAMGLLAGGGYAQYVNIHEDLAMPFSADLTYQEAAAIPEVFLTAYQALVDLSKLKRGEQVLIHAGASGVGTAAIQLSKLLGASKIFVTASKGKHQLCSELGADHCIDYRAQDFSIVVNELTNGGGVDVVMDFLMAAYFQQNLNTIAMDGRLVMLASMGGIKASEINLLNILRRRIRIIGTTLRSRSLEYKINLTKGFLDLAFDKFESGELKPVVDKIFNWEDVGKAHQYMEDNLNQGKVILKIGE